MGVLIGFDDTAYGLDALALGLQLAGDTNEPVTVAVAFPDDERGLLVAMNDRRWLSKVRGVAERKLGVAREQVGDRPDVTFEALGPASASRALHEFAEQTQPDVIVMGSSERSVIGRISPGSTAERLLHGAPCPVAVAPRGYSRHAASIGRIAVAFDGQPQSEQALALAARLAERLDATLHLVAVAGGTDAQLKSSLEEAAEEVSSMVSATTEVVVDSDVVEALADLPGQHPDLLICGSRGYGPVRQVLLGSVSARVIRNAAYPVLVVPRHEPGSTTDPR